MGLYFRENIAMKSCNPDSLKKWVKLLAGKIGPRPYSDPKKLEEVAGMLREYLLSLGYRVELQEIFYSGNKYFNVIASGPGQGPMDKSLNPLLVVGAHYDTVYCTPGADDNASAVAGLLELARILSHDPPSQLRMAFFCLEEPSAYRTRKMGSYQYARALRNMTQPLTGMICLEMIGYFSERPGSQRFPLPFMDRLYPSTGNFIALVGNTKSRSFTERFKRAFSSGTDLPAETLNAPCVVIGIDFSDHWSFYKMGYQALMVTDTAFYRNPNYHRPTDIPSTLNYDKAAKVVDGLVSAVSILASEALNL